MTTTIFLIVIIVGVSLGIIGSLIISVVMRRFDDADLYQARIQRRLEELESEGRSRQQLIEELEAEIKARQPKRHTHATSAGLEDALAVAIDVLNEYHNSQKYTQARVRQLQEILKIIRAGPLAYDEERPAGRRPGRDD